MAAILGAIFSTFTNLDSKFYKSFKYLFSRPGFLTAEFIAGRRKPYLGPFQIYLLASIVFYILLHDVDAFMVPSIWFFNYEEYGIRISTLVAEKMEILSVSKEELGVIYDGKVSTYSKLFLVVNLPILALISWIFKHKIVPEFGKHFIFSTHNFSFFILTLIIIFPPIMIFDMPKLIGLSLVFLTPVLYVAAAHRRLWQEKWWQALLHGITAVSILILVMFLYRYVVSYLTLVSL